MEIIDLRRQPKGCTSHPLIRLKRFLENNDAEVMVITDPEIIPIKTIEIIARKYERMIETIDEINNTVTILITRRCQGIEQGS